MDNQLPWDPKKSKWYHTDPFNWLKLGDRVKAIRRVYDLPGNADQGPIHAEEDEYGTVVHVQVGCWPTVQFDRTRTSTCVTDFEVELCSS